MLPPQIFAVTGNCHIPAVPLCLLFFCCFIAAVILSIVVIVCQHWPLCIDPHHSSLSYAPSPFARILTVAVTTLAAVQLPLIMCPMYIDVVIIATSASPITI
jgi:hypothetical protein